MNFGSQPAPAWPTTVAFASLYDATTFGRTVHMTHREERRLRAVLAAVRDYGFADVIAHLRASLGAPFADAALAAAEPPPRTRSPRPSP